jgi:hypothetical protein
MNGIDNLVDMITNRRPLKIGWNKISGTKVAMTSLKHEIVQIEHDTDETKEDEPKKKRCKPKLKSVTSTSHGYTATSCNENMQQRNESDEAINTSTPWLRDRTHISYAPQNHPLDDAPSPGSVPDIPFPKKIG